MPFFFVFLFVLNVDAVNLSRVMSQPEGASVQTYEIVKGQGKLHRKTNFFGPRNDLRLGLFTTRSNLKSIERKINSLTPSQDFKNPEGHVIYFKVDDKFVDPTSPLHSKLEKQFAALQKKEWDFVNGIELSADLTELREFKDGKLKQKTIFPQSHHCDQVNKELVCKFKDTGILYVR